MSGIMSFVNSFFQMLWDFGAWLLDGALYVLKFALYVPYDAILTVVQAAILSVSFAGLAFDGAAEWANLPPQMIYILNAIGFPAGLTMLASALFIRLVLNLIPASLTRV